jgi:hypothetical protein
MRSNKIKNSGGAGAIRRWRWVAVMALVVGMSGASIAWAAPGDGPDRVGSFRSKFVTVTSGAMASVAVEAGHRPHVGSFGWSLIGRRAERSDVIA